MVLAKTIGVSLGGGLRVMFSKRYNDVVTVENVLTAWEKFLRGKRRKNDVIKFQSRLADNLILLYRDLEKRIYKHGPYFAFNISDPKPRNIHKASVRDRLLHHIIYRELYPYFEPRFIYDSYSCREKKGTHRALDRFRDFARQVSKNHTRTCFVLKCDIKKFFASIDQAMLMEILKRHIEDSEILLLIREVVSSFYATKPGIGLPLGNLTSQLFVNIYMHEFDMFMKQELYVKYYIRYADDFVILSESEEYLKSLLDSIKSFINQKLHLDLHDDKVFIKAYTSGVDFLGWVHFPYHRQLRTSTKRKILRNTKHFPKRETINSYRGLLSHGSTYKVQKAAGIAKWV